MAILQEIREPLILVLLMVFLFVTLIQLVYIWALNGRLAFSRKKHESDHFHPVSIIMYAKDEYYNLKENLPFVLHQDHPEFEVIIVNDASADDTSFLLEDLCKEYSNLVPVTINAELNFFKGKKFPLSIGIRSAKHKYVLFLDPDCRPASRNWLRLMQRHFTKEKAIVLGYAAYLTKPSLLHTLIRFDTINRSMHYLSWAKAGFPYMGVGRNLGYDKDLFYEQGGFISHYTISSGDDDLFINRVATSKNTAVETDSDAFTLSRPPGSFSSWIRQKRKQMITSVHYQAKHKYVLGLEWVTGILHYGLFVVLLCLRVAPELILPVFGLRIFSQLFVFKKTMTKLREKDLLLFSPLLEVFFLLFNPAIVLSNRFLKTSKWK